MSCLAALSNMSNMKSVHIKPDTAILRPLITEKAAVSAALRHAYVFEVRKNATKKSIAASIKELYKVTPEKVHMLAIPKKRVFRRGQKGMVGGGKKAYVYLKKGDKIEVI